MSRLFAVTGRGSDKSIYGEKIERLEFNTSGQRWKWLEDNPQVKVYECLNPIQEFLLDEYYGKNADLEEFNKFPLRIAYLDIEVAVADEFPHPEKAAYPINLLTIYDTYEAKYHVFSLEEAVINRPDVVFHHCPTEFLLLDGFLKFMDYRQFNVLSGWNTYAFDLPYIHNRICNMTSLGPERVLELSPLRKPAREKSISFGGKGNRTFNGLAIEGLSQLDYMLLYMKYVIPIEGEKPSYSLNNVCLDEIKEGKTEYEGALKHLYKYDFQKFVEYNINDVELILKLDKKRNFMDLTRMLCSMCLIEHEKVFATSAMVTGGILQDAWLKGVKIPYSKEPAEKTEKFEGAFVKPPEMKRFNYGVTTFDVASLYPNIMIGLNISPETLVGKVVDKTPGKMEMRFVKGGGSPKEMDIEKFNALMATGRYSLASNGAVYMNDIEGLIPFFLKKGFEERIRVKKESERLDKEADKLKKAGGDPSQVAKLREQSKKYKMEEKTRKIILNSTYGVCGSKFSPFYNLSNAEAVTLTGQKIIKMSSGQLEDYIRENYNPGWKEQIIVYNDTDSMHMDNEVVAKKVIGDLPFKDNIETLIAEIDNITRHVNKWCSEELPKIIPMRVKNRIEFVRECVCDSAYYFTKKHYIYHAIDEKGKRKDDFTYKGVQVVQSAYPKFMKMVIKEIIERTIKEDWSNDTYLKYMEDMYQKFKTMDFDDIAMFKGLSSYKEGEGFLQAATKTSGHARAALYYNQLVENMGLKEKYNLVTSGKIRICYVDTDNIYGIDVIGFDHKIPDEFRSIFKPNYKEQFKILFLSMLNDFCECNKWRQWNNLDEYAVDIMSI